MPDSGPQALKCIKALTFDVFGTVVDWRRPVEAALSAALRQRSAEAGAPSPTDAEVALLAQQWRDGYKRFTRGFRPGVDRWKDVDAHHREGLEALLHARGTGGAPDAAGVAALSMVWHRLAPWPDSAPGLAALGGGSPGLGLVTAALSNGNRALLEDLDSSGRLGFARLFSAEDFGAYKPDPRVYLGAVEGLGLEPRQVAMVAAHLGDLDAARRLGLRTVYVERDGEEDWEVGSERYEAARAWVDLWVGVGEGGLVEVAARLRDIL